MKNATLLEVTAFDRCQPLKDIFDVSSVKRDKSVETVKKKAEKSLLCTICEKDNKYNWLLRAKEKGYMAAICEKDNGY